MLWKEKRYVYPVYTREDCVHPTTGSMGWILEKGIALQDARFLPYLNHELISIIRYVYWLQNGYQSALSSLSGLKREDLWALLLDIISVRKKRISTRATMAFLRFLISSKHPEVEDGEKPPTKARYEPSLTNTLIDKSAYVNKLSELTFCLHPTAFETDEGGTFEIRKRTCSLGGNHSKTFIKS